MQTFLRLLIVNGIIVMEYRLLLLLLFNIKIDSCETSKLADKAAFIASSVYKERFATCVVWGRSESEDITDFLEIYTGSVCTADIDTDSLDACVQSTQLVFFAAESNEFLHYMKLVNENTIKIINLILVLTKPETKEELNAITKIASNNDAADIIILSMSNDKVKVSTYFPYGGEICENHTPVTLKDDTNFFMRKYRNFNGCPIRVSPIHFTPFLIVEMENNTATNINGIDGHMFKIVFEILNATIEIVPVTDNSGVGIIVNNTWSGSFGNLINKRADIFLPASIINPLRYHAAQVTHAYRIFVIIWCAPPRREIHPWTKLLVITSIMYYFIPTVIAFVVVLILLKRKKSLKIDLFILYKIFFDQQADFVTQSVLMNSLFILWIWFCFIIRITYMGQLVHQFQTIDLEPHFKTFAEASVTVDGYGGPDSIADILEGTPLGDKYDILSLVDVPHVIENISKGRRYLLATDINKALPYAEVMQIIDEPISQTPGGAFMRPNWGGANELYRYILNAHETGFLKKFVSDYYFSIMIKSNTTFELKPLNIVAVTPCYYILFIGWITCSIVLCFEIVLHNIFKRG